MGDLIRVSNRGCGCLALINQSLFAAARNSSRDACWEPACPAASVHSHTNKEFVCFRVALFLPVGQLEFSSLLYV
jgi:hypothetical protein